MFVLKYDWGYKNTYFWGVRMSFLALDIPLIVICELWWDCDCIGNRRIGFPCQDISEESCDSQQACA